MNASGIGRSGSAGRGFFDKCGIPFTEHLIDDYRLQYDTYRTSTLFKYSDASWDVSRAVGGID